MAAIDWTVVAVYALFLAWLVIASRRRAGRVASYLVAGRGAGKYLLASSAGMMWLGLAIAAAEFEKFYAAGFGAVWWILVFAPLGYLLSAFGWISYRFRRTEAMTLGQFFEMRYSRRFRVCAGAAMLFAGLLNYGIFPSVSAEILVSVAGLPRHFWLLGAQVPTVSATVAVLVLMGLAVAWFGGFVGILLADFFQSHLFYVTLLAAMLVMIARLGWSRLEGSFLGSPARLNPFAAGGGQGFDVAFFVLLALRNIYNYDNWPSGQGFMAAAKSPHEAKMAGILGEWRNNLQMFALMGLAFCAFALVHAPGGFPAAESILARLASGPAARSRLIVPAAAAAALPAGMLGLFCCALLGASLARDNTDLLTWGEVIVQDMMLPLRRRPYAPAEHLIRLRLGVAGVAAFVLLWSWFFPLRQYVWLYLNLSGSVYLGGSGVVLIGGLYWRRGTTAGAWAAMIAGAAFTLASLALQTAWPHVARLRVLAPEFPLNGMWVAFWASAAAVVAYVGFSLLGPGSFRAAAAAPESGPTARQRIAEMWRTLGGADRIIYAGQMIWSFGLGALCLGVAAWNFFVRPLGDRFWRPWWAAITGGLGVISVATLLWLLIGGIGDVRDLLRSLKAGPDENSPP